MELGRDGDTEELDDGGTLTTWRDPSRASLAVYRDHDGRVRSVLPFLDGAREVHAQLVDVLGLRDDPDSSLVFDLLGVDAKPAKRVAILAQDYYVNRERLQADAPMTVSIAGHARKYVVRAPNAPTKLAELGDAETKLVATGLVAHKQGRADFCPARVLLRAKIQMAEARMNRSCHEEFQRARVRCEGFTFDLVAPLDDERPGKVFEQGAIVEGSFVLLGTMVILNLFVGVIMSGMDEAQAEQKELARMERAGGPPTLEGELDALHVQLAALQDQLARVQRAATQVPTERVAGPVAAK